MPALRDSCDESHEPMFRFLLPLPALLGLPTARCPYCGASPVDLDTPRSFACGASWSGPAGRIPCGAVPALELLARLRVWCAERRLWAGAALLRRYLPRDRPVPRGDGLGWLLPTGARRKPEAVCPCCGAPVRARDPGCVHYACGCVFVRISKPGAPRESWLACGPCQQPSVTSLLQVLAAMPDNPMGEAACARFRQLLVDDCWI